MSIAEMQQKAGKRGEGERMSHDAAIANTSNVAYVTVVLFLYPDECLLLYRVGRHTRRHKREAAVRTLPCNWVKSDSERGYSNSYVHIDLSKSKDTIQRNRGH